jgi:hypothetical protein
MNNCNLLDLFSDDARNTIEDIDSMSARNIDDLIKIREASDKSLKIRSLLDSWVIQQTQERKLRKLYAICFILFLGIQLLSMIAVFFLIGYKQIAFSDMQFNTFFIYSICEIAALVFAVTNYLFPKNNDVKIFEKIKEI